VRRELAAAVALVAVLAACGSTVPDDQGSAAPFEDSAASGFETGVTRADGGVVAGADVIDASGSASPSSPGASTAPTPAIPGAGAEPVPSSGAIGPGVTDDTIKVAYEFYASTGGEEFGGSFGDSDPEAYARAMVDLINGSGGILGRQLEVTYRAYESNLGDSVEDDARKGEAACADYTQDDKHFAVLSEFDHPTAGFVACLAKADTLLLHSASFNGDTTRYEIAGGRYYTPDTIEMIQAATAYGRELAAEGFFDGDVRIGLMVVDLPEWRRAADEGLKPALAAAGHQLTDEVAITFTIEDGPAQVSSAVLKFKSEGIDRVLMLAPGGVGPLFIMTAAESQQYRPRYGLSSYDQAVAQLDLVPRGQLEGMAGVGWMPLVDVSDYRSAAPNPRAEECFAILERAGVVTDGISPEFAALKACELFWLLQEALAGSGGSVTSTGFAAGAHALGASFASPLTFGTYFAPGRHDGAALVRPFAYLNDCECIAYTGDPRPR
jgi:ABC-type branched-subunit amino acid transport system substrate-binding protein